MTIRRFAALVWLFGFILLIAGLTGCSSVQHYLGPGWAERMDSDPQQKFVLAESAWHTLNAVDTMQTLHAANSPECFSEADPLTRSIIGEHPNKAEVVAIGLAYSVAYRFIARWLARKAADEPESGWADARVGFHIIGLGTKAFTVARNHAIGTRPFGRGC